MKIIVNSKEEALLLRTILNVALRYGVFFTVACERSLLIRILLGIGMLF